MPWTIDDVLTLQALERSGITFTVRDGRLYAKPPNAVDPKQHSWIVERKAALLELLPVRAAWAEIEGRV